MSASGGVPTLVAPVNVSSGETGYGAPDATAPRWQVSNQGGSRPRWSGDRRALFYVALDDLSIMRADVRIPGAGFESDVPRVFAEIPVMPVARSPLDVSADGRVLLLERSINQGVPLAVVTNWLGLGWGGSRVTSRYALGRFRSIRGRSSFRLKVCRCRQESHSLASR